MYIDHPQGFEITRKESHVCSMKKSLYGIKPALRAWYYRIDGYLYTMGLTKSEENPNLYFIFVEVDLLILVLYVNDMFLIGLEKLIARCKTDMAAEFEMKDIGLMHYFLGLEVWQRPREIFLW